MGQTVKFLDFSVDTQTHQLSQAGKTIDLASTGYKLLSYFLENPSVTLSRQQLISHVWSNRIVSETSLDKLIQRLRKILGDTGQHKTIISTVHGEGFIFLPEVHVADNKALLKTQPKNNKKIKFFSYVLLPIILLVYYASTDIDNKDDIPIISQAQANPIVLALIPNITGLTDKNQAWMTQGGIHYLKEQLSNTQNLEIKNISLKSLSKGDPNKYALELNKNNQTHSALIVEVKEKDGLFTSEVMIRKGSSELSKESFSSESIKTLYDEMGLWAKNILKRNEQTHKIKLDNNMSESHFAIENYIRGMSAQLNGDSQKAIQYFELATQEDSNFWLAWYELTISYRKQGNSKKALSLLKSLKLITHSKEKNVRVISSESNIHFRLGEYNIALEKVNSSISLAKELNHDRYLSIALSNRAMIARKMKNLNLAIDSINESLLLVDTNSDEKYIQYCSSYNNLSSINYELHNLNDAKKYALISTENCKKSGNKKFELNSKSLYAFLLIKSGDLLKAENLIYEIITIKESLNDKVGLIDSLLSLVEIDLIIGRFKPAELKLARVSDLINVTNNKYNEFWFYQKKSELMILMNNLLLANEFIDKLSSIAENSDEKFSTEILRLRYHEKKNETAVWQNKINQLLSQPEFEDKALIYFYKAKLAILNNHFESALNAFKKATQLSLTYGNPTIIAKIINSYAIFLISQKKLINAKQLIDTLKDLNTPDYPLFKTKALLAFSENNLLHAVALMEEQKIKAADHWSSDDQLLLEKYQSDLKNL